MNDNQVIADTTFYLVFLLDINKPSYLQQIVSAHDFSLPALVDTEIRGKLAHEGKLKNYYYIEKGIKNSLIKRLDKSRYGAMVKYIAGQTNPRFGEYEVIAASYGILKTNPYLCIIIDDKEARDIVKAKKKLKHIFKSLKWTTEFVRDCYFLTDVLKRKECLQIIHDMKNVKRDNPDLGALDIPHWKYDILMNEIGSFNK